MHFFFYMVQTFCWSVMTINCGAMARPGSEQERRVITADASGSVALPAIPMAGEASVHLLTAVRFPPPALFFADPNKEWTMSEFEKPDRATTYAVTDDDGDDDGTRPPPHDSGPWYPETATAGPEAEPATTAAGEVGDDCDGHTTGGGPLEVVTTTTTAAGPAVTEHRGGDDDGQPQQSTTAAANAADVRDQARRRPVPAGLGGRPRPSQQRHTILLTGRPLPPPPLVTDVRLPEVDYVVVRRRDTPVVNLRYFL